MKHFTLIKETKSNGIVKRLWKHNRTGGLVLERSSPEGQSWHDPNDKRNYSYYKLGDFTRKFNTEYDAYKALNEKR